MNLGLSNELKEAFSDILPAPTPLSPIDQEIKDPNWLAGRPLARLRVRRVSLLVLPKFRV